MTIPTEIHIKFIYIKLAGAPQLVPRKGETIFKKVTHYCPFNLTTDVWTRLACPLVDRCGAVRKPLLYCSLPPLIYGALVRTQSPIYGGEILLTIS